MLTKRSNGFTLIELVITVAVLAILTLGVIPLVQVSSKRQKEEQLRSALRDMREAIDQFHREALAGQAQPQAQTGQTTTQQEQSPRNTPATTNQAQPVGVFNDPRVRVFISDQTLFTADNPDRYPPSLETLVQGVDVLPVTIGGLGRRGNLNFTATEAATEDQTIPKTKTYLRRIPIDPMTGKADWCVSSCYDSADDSAKSCSASGDTQNVFNVHSRSDGKALDGTKYSEW